jgi:hypothetical protein
MEKKNEIFDISLDSLLGNQQIEVEAVNDGAYPDEIIPSRSPKEKEKEAELAKVKAENEKDLIDLDINNEEVEEEDDDGGIEEISEEPSSNKETSPQKSKSKTSSPLTPYAQLLVDEGVLPNLDVKSFDGTAESLKEAMITEIIGAIDMYKDSLPDRVKNLINNYEEGVPFEKLLEFDRAETSVTSVTEESLEEDVTLQKKIVTDYLKKTTKFSDGKITKLVDGYEDSGDLEDEAKTSLTELKGLIATEKTNELKNVVDQKKIDEDNRKRELLYLQEKIKTTTEIIPGMKMNDKVKNNVLASMTTPVGYDQYGRPVNKIVASRMENPVEFEMRLHYLFEITKGFTDFTKLAEKGKKDATKAFEEAVSQMDDTHYEEHEKGSEPLKTKSLNFLKGLEKTYHI